MSQDNGAHVEDGATTDASLASRAKNPKKNSPKWWLIALAVVVVVAVIAGAAFAFGGKKDSKNAASSSTYADTVTIGLKLAPTNLDIRNTYTIHELQANAADILHAVQEEANKQIKGAKMNLDSKFHDGANWVDQGEIAGCAGGTFDNICAAADILRGQSCGNGAFTLSIYPGSMPALSEIGGAHV